MSEYVPNDPTVPLALWQSLNREYERVAKGMCKIAFEYEKLRRESVNHVQGTLPGNGCGANMIWTRNKPTRAGWYWWRDSDKSIELICYVEPGLRDTCVSFAYGERYRMMSDMDGQWSGPLEPPTEG